MEFHITGDTMHGMVADKGFQEGLRRMAKYTLEKKKEACIQVSAYPEGFDVTVLYGRKDDMKNNRPAQVGRPKGAIDDGMYVDIFNMHTHTDAGFPIFSEHDLSRQRDPEVYGVSVVGKDKSLYGLLWAPVRNFDSKELDHELESYTIFNKDGYPVGGDKGKILAAMSDYGPAAFVDFKYRNGIYVPDKAGMKALEGFAPFLNDEFREQLKRHGSDADVE